MRLTKIYLSDKDRWLKSRLRSYPARRRSRHAGERRRREGRAFTLTGCFTVMSRKEAIQCFEKIIALFVEIA